MAVTQEDKELYVMIWSKAIDTQMHFNEMSVRARQFGLAFVAAALGLGVVILSRGQEAAINVPYLGGFRLHATVFITLASAVSLYAVKLLDLRVYHRMLRGAVTFGEDFEQTYMKEIFQLEKGMTQAISQFSRYDDASASMSGASYKYTGGKKLSAEKKIEKFYSVSISSLVVLASILFLITADLKMLRSRHKITAASCSF